MSHMPAGFVKQTDKTLKKILESNPIYEWRKVFEYSLRKAAVYIGVTPTAVHNWETGIATPTDENFLILASVMNRPVEELLEQWNAWSKLKSRLIARDLEHV